VNLSKGYAQKVRLKSHLFFFTTFYLLGPLSIVQAQEFPTSVDQAYQNILKLKIEQGRSQIKSYLSIASPFASAYYVENLADVLELMITEDPATYRKLEDNEKIRMDLVEALDENDPYKKFYEAEFKIQWAFVKLKFGEEFSAAWNIRQAYKLISANKEKFPEFLPNNKTLGLLHIMIGSVPEKYEWILSLLGMEGTIQQGIEEIESLANSNSIFSFEASILTAVIRAYMMQDYEQAIKYLVLKMDEEEDNLLLRYLLSSILMKSNQSQQALVLLRSTETYDTSYLHFQVLEYMKGDIYLRKGAYDSALYHYNLFLDTFQGRNLVKDTYYKKFLCFWLSGHENQASEAFELAKNVGTKNSEADKNADRQLGSNQYPNRSLMKIRLYTDGGYFAQAQQLLSSLTRDQFESHKDQVEYYYRLARLNHKQGNIDKAIENYENTLDINEDEPWYFAPNSALQLGYIHLSRQDTAGAISYFEQAISYKKHAYKNSIDHKARSAINRLSD